MRVTEQNINHYLNMLALYRLAKRPRKQIKYFLKGKLDVYVIIVTLCMYIYNQVSLR